MLSILQTNINDRSLIIKTSYTKKMEAYNIPFLLCILTSHLIYDFIFIYGINILILTTMLAYHSPDKQNRSPESHRLVKKTHKKNGQSENEQIDFAYKNSSPSPTRRKSNNLDQFDCQFKLIDCAPDQALWKTKALLADREFEVKKLQQDFAEYKLLSRMQKQKALKKLRDQLQSQKRKHGEEIKKWEAKFEQMQDNQQKQLKKYKTQIQIYYKKHEENQLNSLREKYGKQLNISELKCEMIEQQLRLMCKQLKERHQLQMQELKLMYQKEKEEMKNIHNEEIKKTEQIFQIKVMQVETQKQTKIKLVEETKKQTIMKEQKYLTQIGKMQRQRKALSQKYDEIEMKYKVMNKRYEDKQRQIQTLQKEHQTQIKELSDQLQKNRRQTEQKIQKQRLKILKDEYVKTERLQNKLINLEQVKEKIIDQHVKNQRVLERKFELRESRKEDIEIIKEIETELAYKERQKNRLYQNLKLAKLQRQNDDKIYTRIFTSSRSKRKSSTNRNNSDIYAILKQSHTADFRHLLKLSKKNEKQNHK